jgi:hypothetical protein
MDYQSFVVNPEAIFIKKYPADPAGLSIQGDTIMAEIIYNFGKFIPTEGDNFRILRAIFFGITAEFKVHDDSHARVVRINGIRS